MDNVLERFEAITTGNLDKYCTELIVQATSSSSKHAGDMLWAALGALEGLEREFNEAANSTLALAGSADFIRVRRRGEVILRARKCVYDLWEVVLTGAKHPKGLLDAQAAGKLEYLKRT